MIYAPAPEPGAPPSPDATADLTRRRWAQEVRLKRRRRRTRLAALLGLCAVAILGAGLALLPEPEPVSSVRVPVVGARPEPPVSAASLRPEWERIAARHRGYYSALAFDPRSGQAVAMNADQGFYAASLGKLPVLITLYKAAAGGRLDLDEEISILPRDVQAYGTGVLYEYPLGHTMTLRECAEYMMKESDNTAWYMLERRLGREEISAQISAIGADDTDYLTTFTTTSEDVLLMLKKIADPGFTSEALSDEMLATMTDTAYDDRLPGQLPEDARVANKIGTYGDVVGDAGVVFYSGKPEGHYFVVVVGQLTTEEDARPAIQEMSLAAYETFAEPRTG